MPAANHADPAPGSQRRTLRHISVRVNHAHAGISVPVMLTDVILPCLNEAAALPWVLDPDAARLPGHRRRQRLRRRLGRGRRAARRRGRRPSRSAASAPPATAGCWPRPASWSASWTPTDRWTRRPAAGGRPGRWPAGPTWCSGPAARPGAAPGRCTPGWATGPSPTRSAAGPASRLHDLGPMRAARRADAARAGPHRPPVRLPAGDGRPGRRGRLADRRARRALPPAHRPVQGHRHRRRHAADRPRHAPGARGMIPVRGTRGLPGQVVVIAKEPVPGRVKTRLTPDVQPRPRRRSWPRPR